MTNLRDELGNILQIKDSGAGFHYVQKAQKLKQIAQESRQLSNLIKTPVGQWRGILSDTRYVLNELKNLGIS